MYSIYSQLYYNYVSSWKFLWEGYKAIKCSELTQDALRCVLKLLEMQSRIFNSCIPVCAETFEAHAFYFFFGPSKAAVRTVSLTLASWLRNYVLILSPCFAFLEQFLKRNQNATRRSYYMVSV